MGIVYEGFDPFIERAVAIKTIQKSLIDQSEAPEVFSRFRREAQAAGRLSHPNIVSIYEYGEEGDVAFIAMELLILSLIHICFHGGSRQRALAPVALYECGIAGIGDLISIFYEYLPMPPEAGRYSFHRTCAKAAQTSKFKSCLVRFASQPTERELSLIHI